MDSPRPANRQPRSWIRAIVPVAAIGVALGTFAVAQAATGGTDSSRDLVERNTFATDTPTTTSTSLPDDNGGLSGGHVGDENRSETFEDGGVRGRVRDRSATVSDDDTSHDGDDGDDGDDEDDHSGSGSSDNSGSGSSSNSGSGSSESGHSGSDD